MQNKGIVKFIAVLLILVCCFYLSFSFVTRHYESKAAAMGEEAGAEYLDSIKNEKVYMGIYSLKQCREMEIGLGLDLKGGMNVILEVSVPDVVDVLADHKQDAAYKKAMELAKKEEETSQNDFISLFVKYWKQEGNGRPLAAIFATQQMKGKVSTQSSDSEVEAALRAEVQSAVDNSFNVVRNRIDKFGVVQPNIQKLEGQSGRIMVEMPGIKEPERVRKLLQGSANLEFWETYNSQEVTPLLAQLNQRYAAQGGEVVDSAAVAADTTAVDTAKAVAAGDLAAKLAKKDNKATDSKAAELAKKQNPLFSVFQPTQGNTLAVVGYANARDTAEINKIIYSDIAARIFPSELKLRWGAKAEDFGGQDTKGDIFELYALKITEPSGRAPLEGDVITSAKDDFDQMGHPSVSMQMNSDGARRWSQITKQNIGKAVAIVLDDAVYSAPRILTQIDGGNSQITGNFTIEDTKDLANTLNSGKMPAPTRIVQEEVVGPSLGAQSIQQGIISFIVAFVLLMIYMILLYGFVPGILSDIALLFNLFFTLGILTSFQAALTMPGIAGIVLTLGTAVDANVLIYERIKEELKKGLGVKEALNKGYSNAFSAIFDSNFTSLITGIILLYFGTGPVKGFATTWIIGIVCSFFTAVYLTRIVYDYMLKKDKWTNLTFVTGYSKNLMQNAHYNFMGTYKKSFVVYGVFAILFCISFAVRGLSQSIDFTGGRNYVVTLDKVTPVEEVRQAMAGAFINTMGEKANQEANTSVIALGTDGKTVRISTNWDIESNNPEVDDQAETILFNTLKKAGLVSQANVDAFKNPDVREGGSIISSQKVGPSVAKDITYGAIISVLIALVAIFLYILLRFRNLAFSVGAIVALALDALVVLGLYSALWGILPMSLEIDQVFIGAILTVIGYSINDKVVVFDRIRENIGLYGKRDRQQLFNDSLNQTLARTINTSVTTLIVLLAIFILGGDSIRSFSFAMILGVVFGTLSSLFIAAPTAYLTMGRTIKEDTAETK
ncbi:MULTISPECIES: protein translocase subunit SecDF [unclassified Prevotella]|jgi:SecD/SecF fusion protein|uniref:protein translocase subunit SecDF n=1 Tax=unclassified Prevotella TaxID=2638335 RepID=UPI00056A6438|nr:MULTISPECIES: protein translocase subunit SecDF [unclassified Prevotella]SEV94911.1 SecD/SecF fusion protein [Prevotella sp. khp7]